MRLVCPKCGSQDIIFGRDFLQYRYWQQSPNYPTYYYEFEYGDDAEEDEECKIVCSCQNHECNHSWEIEGSVDDYLDG